MCNENYDFSVPAHCYEGRHLGNLSGRGKRYFSFKVSYYPNADASFQIQNIITSGDIALNPGPTNSTVKYSVCGKTVARNHRAVECDACSLWCHIKCGKVNAKTYTDMMNTSQLQWTCPVCLTNLQSNACLTNLQPTASASEMPVRANCQDSEIDVYKMLRSTLGNRNLKIGHINVNGLLAKLADIHLLLSEVKFDLLGITETHLTDDISNNLIKIIGYDLARRDRSGSKGGGVVIYFREDLNVYEDLKWNVDQELEAVCLNITIRSQSTLIGCLYRPSKSTTFFNFLHALLNRIWIKRKNVILLGDFNSNLISDSHSAQDSSQAGKRLKSILGSFGYSNLTESPTRVTANSKSLIDLIIVSPNHRTSNIVAGSLDLGSLITILHTQYFLLR